MWYNSRCHHFHCWNMISLLNLSLTLFRHPLSYNAEWNLILAEIELLSFLFSYKNTFVSNFKVTLIILFSRFSYKDMIVAESNNGPCPHNVTNILSHVFASSSFKSKAFFVIVCIVSVATCMSHFMLWITWVTMFHRCYAPIF